MNNQNSNDFTWSTNIYTPEGSDRPTFNRPVTKSASETEEKRELTLAEIVSEANKAELR